MGLEISDLVGSKEPMTKLVDVVSSGLGTLYRPRLLGRLNAAAKPEDMNLPAWGYHGLQGQEKGRYAVSVNRNWRLTFAFEGEDAVLLNYEDFH